MAGKVVAWPNVQINGFSSVPNMLQHNNAFAQQCLIRVLTGQERNSRWLETSSVGMLNCSKSSQLFRRSIRAQKQHTSRYNRRGYYREHLRHQ